MYRILTNKRSFFIVALLVGLISVIPFMGSSLVGNSDDLIYHLERIEAVKDALLSLNYPAYVDSRFLDGYGYGTSLFYPDFFLLFPACLRLLHVPMIMVWRIFVFFISVVGFFAGFYSIKHVVKRYDIAILGASIYSLSEFALADIGARSGVNEYIALMFIPILLAGIYDFFVFDASNVWLLGVAFSGFVLSHIITTFNAIVITFFFFCGMLFFKTGRMSIFCRKNICNLIMIALCTITVTAFFVFPMLEQMVSGTFMYSKPWAHVGDYTQQLSSFFLPIGGFSYVADLGVGIPLLLLFGAIIFMKKSNNIFARIYLLCGFCLLLGMTKIFPWKIFNNTLINSIQFTYRLYPFAICFLIFAICLILSENKNLFSKKAFLILFFVTVISGLWEAEYLFTHAVKVPVTDSLVEEMTDHLGQREYMPAEFEMAGDTGISVLESRYGDKVYTFSSTKEGAYELPLTYYKGYSAWNVDGNTESDLPVRKSSHGLVEIQSDFVGTIYVSYKGTIIQKASLIISLIGVAFCVVAILKRKK